MIIDTHQHFWKLDRGDYSWLTPPLAPLYRDFLPADLKPLLAAAGVDGTIAVQAADTEAETRYLLGLADAHAWILGVVGWVDLEAAAAPAAIANLVEHPKLVGLRPMIQDMADDAWMLRDALAPAIAAMIRHDLTFDALVKPHHLRHLKEFLARYPDLRVVIDHCAKPEIRNRAFDDWARDMAEIGRSGRVFCKLSGLVTEAAPDWQPDDLAPYVKHVLSAFPPNRLIFGSDWPVLNLASDYGAWISLLKSYLGAASETVLGDVPLAAYPRLNV
jgi:L-fuconolactonase